MAPNPDTSRVPLPKSTVTPQLKRSAVSPTAEDKPPPPMSVTAEAKLQVADLDHCSFDFFFLDGVGDLNGWS